MLSEIEVVRMLLDIDEAPYKSVAIRCQIKKLLNRIERQEKPEQKQEKPEQDPPKTEQEPEKTSGSEEPKLLREKDVRSVVIKENKSGGAKQKFDTGKMKALRQAGWSMKAIADEMKCTEQTVRNHMKKEGIK